MNGPWSLYPEGDPQSKSANWTQVVDESGVASWKYIGPVAPVAPTQPAYNITGGGDYSYTAPPAAPPASNDYFALPGAQAPAAGALPGAPTGYGGGASDFMSPVATGIYGLGTPSSLPVAPGTVPLPNAAGTPQYAAGSNNSGFVAGGGGGGYSTDAGGGYSNPPGVPSAGGGGMMMPNGQMFGAPKQMAPDGSFDPFLWSGTSNPMPPPSQMRTDILGELGLLPNQPMQSANPMPPRQYVEAKLGVGSAGAPALPMPPPPPQQSLPVAPVGGIPNLPPPILPGTRRRY